MPIKFLENLLFQTIFMADNALCLYKNVARHMSPALCIKAAGNSYPPALLSAILAPILDALAAAGECKRHEGSARGRGPPGARQAQRGRLRMAGFSAGARR